MIDQALCERIAALPHLRKGSHNSPEEGMCVMEAVAYVAGEPFSDHPACVCSVIGAFMRNWNDALPDAERDALLRPLIPMILNTRGSAALSYRRALMAADWLVREHTPAWLRLAGLTVHADALAELPEITDMAQVPSIRGAIEAARTDADAARAAARAAAGDAAWAALNPTRLALQQSAARLVERMAAATEIKA